MMKYAKKIQLPIDFNSIQITRKIQTLTTSNENLAKFDIFYIKQRDVSLIKSVLPAQAQNNLLSVLATKYSLLSPHIHLKEKSVINFYKKVNGEVTTFYEGNIVRDDILDSGSGDFYPVKLDEIVPYEQFSAEQGDLWIMDTTQPHSVTIKDERKTGLDRYLASNDHQRMLIQLYFNVPFTKMLQLFENEIC